MAAARIRLLTLDAYNTLFKPKGSLSSQYAQEAVKHGVNVSKSAVSQHFGIAYRDQLQRAPFYGLHLGMHTRQWWEELVYATFVGAGANKKDLDPVFNTLFNSLYTRFMTAEGYTTFPDVRRTLMQLRQRGFQMGVISNSDERVLSVIKSLELDDFFDFVLPSCLAGYEKPELQIFEKACEITGVRPEEALHVGDDIEKDYYGARHAGWHATLLKRCMLPYTTGSWETLRSDQYDGKVYKRVTAKLITKNLSVIGKLSYQDSAPDLVPAEMSPGQIPQTIMSLQELCPILQGMHDKELPTPRDDGVVAASS